MKKFCRNCGTKLEERPGPLYDETTGENIPEVFCPNRKCGGYCYSHGGHKFKWP